MSKAKDPVPQLVAATIAVKKLLLAFRDVAKTKEQKDAIEMGIAFMESTGSGYNWRRRR